MPAGDVTRLLEAAEAGDRDALERLVPLVYEDLRRVAHRQLDREGGGHTLQTTALIHEAYLKLAAGGSVSATSRAHFLAIAARAMRQVLVDYARRRKAAQRGGGVISVTLGDEPQPADASAEDLLALDDALEQLEPRQRQVIECRFFGGMEEHDIAAVLGVSERTVRRDWVKARAWLYKSLYLDKNL
ncbi:MAG: sigma-70 family RNA polymerase sigma factor [Gemmatimonadales bacterium]|nr:sigma-70 family RNA polymerase sigma factor [Gemmatimonadales bacterium]